MPQILFWTARFLWILRNFCLTRRKQLCSELSIHASNLIKLEPPHCLFNAVFMTSFQDNYKWCPSYGNPEKIVRIEIVSNFDLFKDLSKHTQLETLMFTSRISDILIIFLFFVTILQSLFLQILETNFNVFKFFLETGTFEYFLRKTPTLQFLCEICCLTLVNLIAGMYVTCFKSMIVQFHICRDLS